MFKLSLRAKLTLIVLVTALSFALVVAAGTLLALQQAHNMQDLEGRLVPALELGPRLDASLTQLSRGFQDAVAAQDHEMLQATVRDKQRMLQLLDEAKSAVAPADRTALRASINDYYDSGYEVSRRLLEGEMGEELVEAIEGMQEKQRQAKTLVLQKTTPKRGELRDAFKAVQMTANAMTRYLLLIGVLCLVTIVALSTWLGRGALRSLDHISRGFARFATGEFSEPIPVLARDELGGLAAEANRMAQQLERLHRQRDETDWLKAGQVGLADQLRGELTPEQAAQRALGFIAGWVKAPVGALYLDDSGKLVLYACHARSSNSSDRLSDSFGQGEGLLGEAARKKAVVVIEKPPAGYLRVESGLGSASPEVLVFVPLSLADRTVGVIELGLFCSLSDAARGFLSSVGETLAITLEAARSRAKLRELLAESQALTAQLSAQEEELRQNNRELSQQQEELRQANDELESQRHALSQQNLELEQARESLQEKANELARVSSYKSQFLANMSHELRTPLNSMLLLSQLLAQNEHNKLTPKQVEHCRTILSAGKELLELINQVLDLARIEAGKQEIDVEPVVLKDLLEHARRSFEPLAANKGLAFVVELDEALPEVVETDRQRLERILQNLVSNAIKFTESGEVALRIGRPAPNARLTRSELSRQKILAISVSDTGIGIAPEAHERIFSPFEQEEGRTNRRYGGTGLGLAIARESALLLGGELQLRSEVGRGSLFVCYLPENLKGRVKQQAVGSFKNNGAAQRRSSRVVARSNDSAARVGTELLVVEDDPLFAEQLVELIRSRSLGAVVAKNGQEALERVREQAPAGIILDVKLPDIDGWTVLEQLRQDPITRSIPVHFISALDAPGGVKTLGALGYLNKPATRDELIGVIDVLTRSNGQKPIRILVVEDNEREGESLVERLRGDNLEAKHVLCAAAALEALENGRFSCVVLDLGLPDMDGLGLLETLRSQPNVEMPPVIVHTGRALTKEEIRRIEAYAEAVVLKDGESTERLLDEIRLFVQHLSDEVPSNNGIGKTTLAADVSLAGTTILIVDDDMRTVYALSALLQGKGSRVLVAGTGREALDVLRQNPQLDLVLMDVMMPEMDGYEAMRQLRKDQRFATVPVIALTAKAMKGEAERCLAAGASAYLAKPVEPQTLLSMLASWLPHGRHHEPG